MQKRQYTMKQINLLSALLLLCLYACNNKPYPHTMQVADKLVYSNPDSACLLLEQLRDSITTEPKATQIYYQLLNKRPETKPILHIPLTASSWKFCIIMKIKKTKRIYPKHITMPGEYMPT